MRLRIFSFVALVALLLACGVRSLTAQAARPPTAVLGTLDLMPRLGKQVMPVAPELKEAAQLDAEIIVGADGAIAHTRVVKSTDATGAFEKACLATMQKWRLTPATQPGGQAVATLVRIRFEAPMPQADGKPAAVQATLLDMVAMPPPSWEKAPVTEHVPGRESGVSWPSVVREIRPRYTQDAMRAKVQGAVEMEVVVLPDGTVGAARVTKGLEPSLDAAALAAARHWLFEPGKLNNTPVPVKVGLVLEFRLH